jgi:hypothetical protein
MQRAARRELNIASVRGASTSPHPIHITSRRRLMQFLAASPLFAGTALAECLRPSDPAEWAPRDLDNLIADPKQALDVFDFEPVMNGRGYDANVPTLRISEHARDHRNTAQRHHYSPAQGDRADKDDGALGYRA